MSTYKFTKDSSLQRPKNISKDNFISASYGDEFYYSPQDIPLKIYHFSGSITGSSEYRLIHSLKNTINYYSANDDMFAYDNFVDMPCLLLAFNSLHLGSGIEKGSINLKTYLSGNIISEISDFREDGVLYSAEDEKVGIALYNEGFILINNTSSLAADICSFTSSTDTFVDNPRWIHAFIKSDKSLYYDIEYNTKNSTPVSTYFINVNKNDLNHSNNFSYIESGSYYEATGSYFFKENEETKIKNTVKSPFVSGSTNFEKQTFITKIGLYDDNKKLIGIASLANPVRKNDNREYTFKVKIDW